jgi:hypothetical protein
MHLLDLPWANHRLVSCDRIGDASVDHGIYTNIQTMTATGL